MNFIVLFSLDLGGFTNDIPPFDKDFNVEAIGDGLCIQIKYV